MPIRNEVFLDASYAIAITNPKDRHHDRAVAISEELAANNVRLVTSHAILLEIGNGLSKARFRQGAQALLESIHSDPAIEIVPITAELYTNAFTLFSRRPDKEWGLTDCVSFEIMRRRSIANALTADDHFIQAGFVALLLAEA